MEEGDKRRSSSSGDPTERMEFYCAENPESPAAMHRPQLMMREKLWIAQLGSSIQQGTIGIGNSVEAALRAFDTQYPVSMRLGKDNLRGSRGKTARLVKKARGARKETLVEH